MDLYARINGKDYPISYGAVFNDELSETLDSGQISIPHVFEIIDIKPYDDIIIHDFAPDENGNSTLPNRPYGVVVDTNRYYDAEENDITETQSKTPAFAGHFYRHMLVWNPVRETVSLADRKSKADEDGNKYFSYCFNYSISLISETKALENIPLPNRTITQPQGTGDGSDDSKSKEAVFQFTNENPKTIPYGVVRSYAQGLKIAEEDERVLGFGALKEYYLLVDDGIASTNDYSFYSSIPSQLKLELPLSLPQWCTSGASVFKVTNDYAFGFPVVGSTRLESEAIPFKKHWIIRKKGSGTWGSDRQSVLSNIQSHLSGQSVDGIVNESLTNADTGEKFPHDISSSDKTASIRVSGFQKGDYIIYLYIDPVVREYGGKSINIYGMTDNSKGTIVPEQSISDPFLCYWEFSASDQQKLSRSVRSVYEAVREAVELYSPYEKVTEDGSSWEWRRKYSIAPETKTLFSNVIAPENQWNNPSLREYITKLFYVCDCIPVVHDRVIGHLSLSERNPMPFDDKKGSFTYDSTAMDGSSYCDRLRREYSSGLSKDNVTRCIERIGFKNFEASTLTLENMRLELAHPIYKIRKVYLCSYKTATSGSKDYYWLCKHDISPLVKLNSERNLLSEDWYALGQATEKVNTVDGLSRFRYATVGYDIGSNYITGWGEKYSYPDSIFFKTTKTIIENIYNFVNKVDPLGVDAEKIYKQEGKFSFNDDFVSNIAVNDDGMEFRHLATSKNAGSELFIPGDDINAATGEGTTIGDYFGKFTQRMKSLFFIVEYDGYVSAAVVASKDFHDGPIMSRDNASASLSFVESDGQNQKEKVNRLGNAVVSAAARYKNLEDIQNISQVWNSEAAEGEKKIHEDEVLYKRNISVFKDCFMASYSLCRDYVLRNYFTSVYSKHRPFALASYEESVERKEVKSVQILFSKDSQYYQSSSKTVSIRDLGTYISFFKPTPLDETGSVSSGTFIDKAYYMVWPSDIYNYPGQCGVFATDFQAFTSGNALCFVVSMKDSSSAGVYQSDMNVKLSSYLGNMWETLKSIASGDYYQMSQPEVLATNLLTGAKQDWHMFPVDPKTGVLYKMSFAVGKMSPNRPDDGESGPFEASYFRIAVASLLPLWDVCFTKPGLAGLETFTYYFGKSTVKMEDLGNGIPVPVHHIVGAGYPNLVFSRRNDDGSLYSDVGTYRVKQVNSSIAYSSKEVYTIVPMFEAVFEDADGYVLPAPPIVNSYAMALFYGHEDEEAEETDDCVFKDGKEKMSVTIELEPVSDSSSIMISPYLMKLSDAVGTFEKIEKDVSGEELQMQILPSVSYRKFWIDYTSVFGETASMYIYKFNVAIPALTIAIPLSILDKIPSGFDIGTEVAWPYGESGYKVKLGKMGAIQEVEGRRFVDVEATITFGNPDADTEGDSGNIPPAPFGTSIRLYEMNSTDFRYVPGRTGVSKCRTSATFALADERQYLNFGYLEDGYSAKVDDEAIDQRKLGTDYAFSDAYPPKKYSLWRQSLSSGVSTGSPSEPADPLSPDGIIGHEMPGGSINYFYTTRIRTSVSTYNGGDPNVNYRYEDEANIVVTESYKSYAVQVMTGIPAWSKAQTMFWVLFPNLLSSDDPYKQLTSLSQASEIDLGVFLADSSNSGCTIEASTATASVAGPCSIRMYYLEDGIYHFVFGFNADSAANAGQRSDCLYPTDNGDGTMSYHVYVSLLDNRSKTVIDATTGDPSYRMANYASEEDVAKVPGKGNWCLPK